MKNTLNVLVVLLGLAVVVLVVAFVVVEGRPVLVQPSVELSADEQVVSREIVNSFGNEIELRHVCDGELTASDLSGVSFCLGDNELILSQSGEDSILTTVVSTSIDDAPLLREVQLLGGRSVNELALLFAFAPRPCVLSESYCGAGMPEHYTNFVYWFRSGELSRLSAYPAHGDLVWGGDGTKALVPVTQVGGAGCDQGSVMGYDLEADELVSLTQETACRFEKGEAQDVVGESVGEWGPVRWSGLEEFTTVRLNPDGTWEELTGTF